MRAIGRGLQGPARRIALAGVALVVLLGLAVGVTVWRYGGAVDADRRALEQSEVVVAAEQARTVLALRGALVDSFGADADRADLRALEGSDGELHAALEKLGSHAEHAAAERAELEAIHAGEERLDGLFEEKIVPVAGTAAAAAGVRAYLGELESVSAALGDYARAREKEAAGEAAAARADADRDDGAVGGDCAGGVDDRGVERDGGFDCR